MRPSYPLRKVMWEIKGIPCDGMGSLSKNLSTIWPGEDKLLRQESSSLRNDDFCWQISCSLEIFDSLALVVWSHKIFALASGSGLKELVEEGHVYLAIYNLYNLNLRGTLLIWNMDYTTKSDKLSRWRKRLCPLFSSAKKYSSTWGDSDKQEMRAASGRRLDGAFQRYTQGYYNRAETFLSTQLGHLGTSKPHL